MRWNKDNEIRVPETRHNLAQREAEGETLGSEGYFMRVAERRQSFVTDSSALGERRRNESPGAGHRQGMVDESAPLPRFVPPRTNCFPPKLHTPPISPCPPCLRGEINPPLATGNCPLATECSSVTLMGDEVACCSPLLLLHCLWKDEGELSSKFKRGGSRILPESPARWFDL